MNTIEINSLVLAYLGDAIYEVYIREYLIRLGLANVNDLQKESMNYVSAKSQSMHLQRLLDNEFFTDEEITILKRARNQKSNSKPKNVDILTYKHSTALEALIGYLYMEKDTNRIEEIIKEILK